MVLDNLPKGFTAISLDEHSSYMKALLEKGGDLKVQDLCSDSQVHINDHLFLVLSVLMEDCYSDSLRGLPVVHILSIHEADTSRIPSMLLVPSIWNISIKEMARSLHFLYPTENMIL